MRGCVIGEASLHTNAMSRDLLMESTELGRLGHCNSIVLCVLDMYTIFVCGLTLCLDTFVLMILSNLEHSDGPCCYITQSPCT
jgi:hypothetical protein